MFRKIVIGVVVVAGVFIVCAGIVVMIAPTDFKVEREVTINKPREEVYGYVKILANQNTWGPWFKKDPAMKMGSRGTDGNVGFVQTWDSQSEEVGAGEQEIKKLVENERVETELRFLRPFESKSDAYISTDPVSPSETRVKWGMTGSMPRPLNVMLLMFDMDKAVGKDFEEGLASLKAILEKQ